MWRRSDSIACCAATRSWVELEGRFEPGDEVNPRLVAASVTVIPTPDDPDE
jgi:hypothetical protein